MGVGGRAGGGRGEGISEDYMETDNIIITAGHGVVEMVRAAREYRGRRDGCSSFSSVNKSSSRGGLSDASNETIARLWLETGVCAGGTNWRMSRKGGRYGEIVRKVTGFRPKL